jgi:conjugal transfer pilus assembly protein TraB
MAEVSKRAAQVRKRQMIVLGAVGAAIAVVSIGASVWLQPTKKRDNPADAPKTKQLTLGGSSTDKEAWRVQSAAELDKMAKRLQELERREADREATAKREHMERQNRAQATAQPSDPVVPPPEPPAGSKTAGQGNGMFSQIGTGGAGQVVPPPTRPGGQPAPGFAGANATDVPTGPRIKSVSIDDSAVAKADVPKQAAGELVNSAKKFGEDEARRRNEKNGVVGAGDGKDRYSDDDPLAYNRAGGRSAETYLPAGTFVRASLLNGLDAPTGGQAQQNPHPVLLRLEDNAQLPNAVRANLKGCFVTGSGHGDLSAERAYIRLDRLTCVDDSGGAIDVAVRGYVSGEDGKTGVRGRLITKSGQVIANALFTGVLAGFGEALRQSSTTTTTAPVTGAQTQTINNALEYGVGTGTAKAMDRISQYYIKLADKLFPIVEVDGGRVVDIVLTRGVSIERK